MADEDFKMPTDTAEQRVEKALMLARNYGSYDGAHHKMWCIDQIVRALCGCPVVEKTHTRADKTEYTYIAQGESEEYQKFVSDFEEADEHGEKMYEWDTGC